MAARSKMKSRTNRMPMDACLGQGCGLLIAIVFVILIALLALGA